LLPNDVKVTFFRGAALHSLPPGTSKHKDVRYLDIREDDAFDERPVHRLGEAGVLMPGERM
jgi:hypothetical protein